MKTRLTLLAALLGPVLAIVSQSADTTAERPWPLIDGLGDHTHPITTSSPEAQKYFDQGLRLLFGFNHGGAIRSFQVAERLDPDCAMAHWGVALANGPHINVPMVPPPAAAAAWDEITKARGLAAHASPLEQALIEALSHRYANPQPDDRSALDLAYADAMRKVWQAYPHDADTGVLFAEAMMDLRPWDQWTPEGKAQPGTDEILATLDAVLKLDLQHPFANHLYIHAVEASPHPERALPAADRLLNLQPGLAHNVHMPSHIYIRVGRWDDAIESNLKAVAADKSYRDIAGPARGFFPLYIAHNEHMLAYAAMMTGRSALAFEHIDAMRAGMSDEFLTEFAGFAEFTRAMPMEMRVRFGRWDEIIAEPEFPASFPFTHAFQHAARAIAYAAKGDTASARKEQSAYAEAAKAVPADEMAAGNNLCSLILGVIAPMVEGEILLREGKTKEGFASLRAAVAAEDGLHYDEPPGWLIPVRHSLGAALLRAGEFAEAEKVYREDLARLPGNGWSLYGLSQALRLQAKKAEAAEVEGRFKLAWQKADLVIHSSCLCQPGLVE
ncbi:MAG TPA: hypothetical protein VHD32_09355 [Candidatus Didemnitutus sp.]|nr:hypothetical protein [Candidatus Didemnitutus sp.]